MRGAAMAAVAMADNSFDKVWAEAAKSPASLSELLSAIPLIYDADIRNLASGKVKPLLAAELPPELVGVKGSAAPIGHFVRIELPGKGPLTLAEVQVFSGGKNIALKCKARQSSTDSKAGDASHAVDGKIDGAFKSGTQTHTKEDESKPWWEVDLGADKPIDSVVVWNRSEENGKYAGRLEGFAVVVLDANRREVFKKVGNAAPPESAKIATTSDVSTVVRSSH